MRSKKTLFYGAIFLSGWYSLLAQANNNLPMLGDSSSGSISLRQEQELGQAWLRTLRTRIPEVHDPLVIDYLESLISTLAANSDVQNHQFDLIVLKSKGLNAFTVPGGVLGINAGLFDHTKTEHELAAVIAHEIAHLSQRHFVRNMENAKRKRLLYLGALLASVAIATADSQAGAAAVMSTQAGFQQDQLHFSREMEREADRLGILTLVQAGMDPYAMPSVFAHMYKQSRLHGMKVPEFLLTHPVSEARTADSLNRAEQYPRKHYDDNLEYHLMCARIQLLFMRSTPSSALKHFQSKSNQGSNIIKDANRYGLVIALANAGKITQAEKELNILLQKEPNRITYIIAQAQLLTAKNQVSKSSALLKNHLELNPGNYPLSYQYAKSLLKQNKAKAAERMLTKLSRKRPNDPSIWYELAETQGLAGNIVGLHQTRAEYYILTGKRKEALDQLGYALVKAKNNYLLKGQIKQRINDIKSIKLLDDIDL